MAVPFNHRLSSCALGTALALLGLSSYSVLASQQTGAGNFLKQSPPLAVLEAMIQPDLTDVDSEILPDSVEVLGVTSGRVGLQSLRLRESVGAEDGTEVSLPGDSDGMPSIKSLAVDDSDSQQMIDGYGPSPITPLQLLKGRGTASGEFSLVGADASKAGDETSKGFATDGQVPVAPPPHRPVVYDPRAFMVADRNYIKQITSLERQSREYNKLVKKATRASSPSHPRKRYGVGVYSDPSSGTPWWMRAEHNDTSQEPAKDVEDGSAPHNASSPGANNDEMEERRLQPRFRIFSQSLGAPKKPRGDRHEYGEAVVSAAKEERDREPFGFAFFRSKQEKDVRNRNGAREGRTEPRDSRRPRDDTRNTKHEPIQTPKRYQAPRGSAPHTKTAVHSEALDDDDFQDYEEFDDDLDEYEEIKPQRPQPQAGSARRRNAQAYGIYIPDVYDRPLVESESTVGAWETAQPAVIDPTPSAAFPAFGVPITKADIDLSQFFADDHRPSVDNAKGSEKKHLFIRRKQQGAAAEEAGAAGLPAFPQLEREELPSQEMKRGPLLGRLKTQQESPHAEEKQKLDLTDVLGSPGWRAAVHAKTKGESSHQKQKSGDKRPPLRDKRTKTQEGHVE
ncbi:conserved hypothetical protein [Neospora caninum Liverpool]|uniref:Uncharacterized protein n=1 Tax=Neospora caninum (strain Liverpool) TaxID=572307 RepID=F0VGC0_NEOCL|nr:conserved hypothetical protein [Neospora caninum Liverpool]CBZ52764.1 conserved hypothetical protein [Neospora caninum Liverpool]CEL66746.1 TPA: hypothetical protein BN1204_025520 [Neospora caninum Liverpool]|eukprot:XP_003882796.1 conserved hypothetical protein [Neospora caninum Liverpool]